MSTEDRPRWLSGLRISTLVRLLVVAFVIHVFVIPQLGGARKALHTVAGVSPLLLAVAVALEAAAILAYAQLTRSLLDVETRPGLSISFGVALASMGVNHVVPGGAATTAAVNYRLFGLAGVPGPELGFALATQAIGSAAVLNLILWVALILSIPVTGFHPIYATAAGVGAVMMVLFGLTILGLLRGRDRLARWIGRVAGHIPGVKSESVEMLVRSITEQLRQLGADVPRLRGAVLLAAVNWLLDAAALWVFMTAFGYRPGVVGLVVAYGLANVLAVVPITPGGLGVIEAVLIPTLVAFGSPAAVAAVGVVAYRLVSFWLPIPTGMAAYVVVERRLTHSRDSAGVQPVITELMEPHPPHRPGEQR